MKNSVSNKIINMNMNLLKTNGFNVDEIKRHLCISDYELLRAGGRFEEKSYFRIISHIDKLISDNPLSSNEIISLLEIDNMYNSFHDLFGYCMNSFSAKDAINKFINYRVIIGDCDQLMSVDNGHETKITYTNLVYNKLNAGGAIPNFLMIYNLIKQFSHSREIEINLMGQPIAYWFHLNEHFGVTCKWNSAENSLTLKNKHLNKQVFLVNNSLLNLQETALIKNVNSINSDGYLSSCIYDSLIKLLRAGVVDAEDSILETVCSEFNFSRWTLYRRLEEQGSSFSQILKKAKLNEACHYLLDTKKSIQEISELSGFSSPTSFTRFFNDNIGFSPTLYRKRNVSI